jgi:endonuclease/exonuclease/phosphatase family metal-dependent hydrolase
MHALLEVLLVLVALVALGCGDNESSSELDGGASQSLSLITYNTGLAVVVKAVEERKPLIIDAFAEAEADVICLQEAFAPVTSPTEIAEALASIYPHAWSSDTVESISGNGLLILSKNPLEAESELLYTENDPLGLTDEMAIAAYVQTGEVPVRVICTHLHAGLDEDSTAVRMAQIDELVRWAGEQGYLDGPTFLLGDFNTGPDPVGECTPNSDPACLAADEASYARLNETFDDPNQGWNQCTQCRDAFLPMQVISLYADEPDQRIDHCFTRKIDPLIHTSSEIVFDDEQSIEFNGETLTTLSDHYGVRCVFEP